MKILHKLHKRKKIINEVTETLIGAIILGITIGIIGLLFSII